MRPVREARISHAAGGRPHRAVQDKRKVMTKSSIKVGQIAELTGPLSFMGQANANVARMAIDDINSAGGLLGRAIELIVEDGETTDSVAAAKARKLVEEDRVDLIVGGIFSSTRQAIKGPAVVEGRTLYIYPEQYEGEEWDPLLFCTGPTPAQQLNALIPFVMQEAGAKKVYLPSSDYIWPRTMNRKVKPLVAASGGRIVGEEYHPLGHMDYRETVGSIMASGADVVFNTIVPPGVAPFLELLHDAGFQKRGGRVVCTYFEENLLEMFPAEHVEGLTGCLDFYDSVDDSFSLTLLRRYGERYRSGPKLTGGSACSGLWRGLKLWEAAVKEAGSVDPEAVAAALDRARIAEGPGGPAAMAPGQHHARMNMYIAQAANGLFRVVKSLGAVDPGERVGGQAEGIRAAE
jgi:branched-chain amino acid transport system substrate-binding protein